MSINDILNKRNAKIQEMKTLTAGEVNTESRAKIDTLKTEIEGLNKDIEVARFLESEEQKEAKKVFGKEERKANENYNVFKAIREYASGNLSGLEKEMHDEGVKEFQRTGAGYTDGLVIPNIILTQRTDVLASNTANFMHTTLANDLKVANTQLILPKLGITRYTGLNGAFDVPNMAELTAYFVAEDAASTVVSVTDNKATLTPRFIAANQVFSKQYLNQTSPQIQNQLIAQFMFSIEKGIEQEVFNALSGLTESSATLSAATWSNILALANYVPYNNAWVSSRTQMAALKAAGKATYQGGFIWQDGEIDGVPAFSSSLVPSTHIYTGDFSQIAVGEWDGGLLILTDPYTNKSKGKIDIQVSALRDAKVLNSAAFAKMVIG